MVSKRVKKIKKQLCEQARAMAKLIDRIDDKDKKKFKRITRQLFQKWVKHAELIDKLYNSTKD